MGEKLYFRFSTTKYMLLDTGIVGKNKGNILILISDFHDLSFLFPA